MIPYPFSAAFAGRSLAVRLFRCVSGMSCALLISADVAQASVVFTDSFEVGATAWSASGSWNLTAERASSPTHCATDSPGSFYDNDTDSAVAMADSVSLAGLVRPVLAFNHRYSLEAEYDFALVEVSTDGGSTWSDPVAAYTGEADDFRPAQLDLAAHAGQADFRVRFRLLTDESVVRDGWHVDDVRIGDAPEAVVLAEAASVGRNSLDLTWSAAGGSFAAYEVYRGLAAGFDWRDAWQVGSVADAAITSFTDITVAPKTKYFYRVVVVDSDGLRSTSNEIEATTLAGMDFPLFDNGEAGGRIWTADSPWALSDEAANSGALAWSDSPGATYAAGIASQALTLSAPVNLSATVNPVLCFNHRHAFASGDYGYVEVSTNGGSDWTALATFGGFSAGESWQRGRVSLAAHRAPSVLVRFRLTSDTGATADGWHIDDISLSEAPATIPAPVVEATGSTTVQLSWQPSTDPMFSHYLVFRSATPGTGINSVLAGRIGDAANATFTDTGLLIDTTYFYRVYAVNTYGGLSADSAGEAQVRTLNNPAPFAEDFESGLSEWIFTGTWGATDEVAHAGARSLADSPAASYANGSDTYAETSVDLSATIWPVLTFWDRFALGAGDWLRVEVIDGDNNATEYRYCCYGEGERSEWRRQQIDLSRFKGRPNVRIRFRLVADGATPGGGWFIDEVSVAENPLGSTALVLPVQESFESGTDQWLASSWSVQEDGFAVDGAHSLLSTEAGKVLEGTPHLLVLAQPVVLPAGSNVQVTLRYRGTLDPYAYFQLVYSTNGGTSWTVATNCTVNGAASIGDWRQMQASLQGLAGQTVRLAVQAGSGYGTRAEDIWIDKVTVAEMPVAVTITSATPSVRSVALEWTPTTLGAAFRRYEVWRHTAANFTVFNGTKLAEITDPAATTFVDTGLGIGATYFYKVITVDDRDTLIPSNEMSVKTVPALLPFADAMETIDNWVAGLNNGTHTWGIASGNPHSGTGCLAVAPLGQYANSSDTWMETAVNLTGLDWPVLTFWDRFALGAGDWLRVEVIDGDNNATEYRYSCYGEAERAEWRRQQIDLSRFKGRPNVRIRFRLVADGATPGGGWFIDDVSVAENPLGSTALVLPLQESFESGTDQWLASSWSVQDDPTAPEGSRSLLSTEVGKVLEGTPHLLVLAQPVVLPAGSNVQVTLRYRGTLDPYAYFQLVYSSNGGTSWTVATNCTVNGETSIGDWRQMQASLQGLAGQTVRLAVQAGSGYGTRAEDIWIDKVTVAEMPAAVTITSATPSVRSVALEWTPTTLGAAFRRYEVWRHTAANFTVFNGTKLAELTDAAATTFVDTGLGIGATYFYKVITVDDRDALIPSNEMSAKTVPALLPFADAMETIDNWVAGLNNGTHTWGIASGNPHSGTGCLAVAPLGQYANSSDTWMETAVNLTGLDWPVLTFWDRFALGAGDWLRVEVIDGDNNATEYRYSCYGEAERAEWRRQQIDLSRFKGRPNVRIRFRLVADGATPGGGWFIDEVSVAENPLGSTALVLPLQESFESGTDQWLASSWSVQDDPTAPEGSRSLLSTEVGKVLEGTPHLLVLAQPVVLPAGSNVQVTLRYRGTLDPYAYFQLVYSSNGGTSWTVATNCTVNGETSIGDWRQMQASLQGLAGQTVRLAVQAGSGYGTRAEDNWIDKVTVAEMPAAVTITSATPSVRSVALEWTPTTLGAAFVRYEVWRHTAANFTVLNGTKVAELADPAATEFLDTNLGVGTSYYYKVFVVDIRDTLIPSNELYALTTPADLIVADPMETMGNWAPGTNGTGTNTWGVCTTDPHGGAGCLALAPTGQYGNSTDSWIEASVDLSAMVWPVLTFWDRYDLGTGDTIRVEVVGSSTQNLYGYFGTAVRTSWSRQQIDLSAFKGQSNVKIRFRAITDGSVPASGWFLDDVSVVENPLAGAAQELPLIDSFEEGSDQWLAAGWTVQVDATALDGDRSIINSEQPYVPSAVSHWLTLARPLSLPTGSTAQLTMLLRGSLVSSSVYFRVQTSLDGKTWTDLSACSLTGNYDSGGWTTRSASLQSFAGKTVRLRIGVVSSSGNRLGSIALDAVGLGEEQPLAPTLVAPTAEAWVPVVRPTLSVANATDPQFDPLTYRFEVYGDAALTQLVAQIPAVASGASTTAWQLDVDLANNAEYWWRARANDGAVDSDWSEVGTFYVNEVNHVPTTPEQLGPSAGAILFGDDDWLFWRESTDSDLGDRVVAYHIQASITADFAAVVVDDASIVAPLGEGGEPAALAISLGALAGSENLVPGTAYYWRIRAEDNRLGWSAWQAEPKYFRFFTTAPTEFQHWQAAIFTISELNAPAVSGELADPDGDGRSNLLEFAFAADPLTADTAGPVVRYVDGHLQISYREFSGGMGARGVDYTARNLRYTVEFSTTMAAGSWQRGGAVVELVPGSVVDHGDGTETVTVRAVVPVASAPRQFLRLVVDTVQP